MNGFNKLFGGMELSRMGTTLFNNIKRYGSTFNSPAVKKGTNRFLSNEQLGYMGRRRLGRQAYNYLYGPKVTAGQRVARASLIAGAGYMGHRMLFGRRDRR